jgi:hypothetical protein
MHCHMKSRRRSIATVLGMFEIARDAPGSVVCRRSGLPLLAICPNGHRRTVPFRLLKTSETDITPLYGRPFKCKACGSPEVVLFAVENHTELNEIQRALAGPPEPAKAPPPMRGAIRTQASSRMQRQALCPISLPVRKNDDRLAADGRV